MSRQHQNKPETQTLHTWYSSALSPAAVATCSSCAGVCFLKIFCSNTKMFADSGEVCSSTARPPYLTQHVVIWSAGFQFHKLKPFLIFKTWRKCLFTAVSSFITTWTECATSWDQQLTKRRVTGSGRTSSPEVTANGRPRHSQAQRHQCHLGGSTGSPPSLVWGLTLTIRNWSQVGEGRRKWGRIK